MDRWVGRIGFVVGWRMMVLVEGEAVDGDV